MIEKLVERAKNGDKDALTRLQMYYPETYSIYKDEIESILNERQQQEELRQIEKEEEKIKAIMERKKVVELLFSDNPELDAVGSVEITNTAIANVVLKWRPVPGPGSCLKIPDKQEKRPVSKTDVVKMTKREYEIRKIISEFKFKDLYSKIDTTIEDFHFTVGEWQRITDNDLERKVNEMVQTLDPEMEKKVPIGIDSMVYLIKQKMCEIFSLTHELDSIWKDRMRMLNLYRINKNYSKFSEEDYESLEKKGMDSEVFYNLCKEIYDRERAKIKNGNNMLPSTIQHKSPRQTEYNPIERYMHNTVAKGIYDITNKGQVMEYLRIVTPLLRYLESARISTEKGIMEKLEHIKTKYQEYTQERQRQLQEALDGKYEIRLTLEPLPLMESNLKKQIKEISDIVERGFGIEREPIPSIELSEDVDTPNEKEVLEGEVLEAENKTTEMVPFQPYRFRMPNIKFTIQTIKNAIRDFFNSIATR